MKKKKLTSTNPIPSYKLQEAQCKALKVRGFTDLGASSMGQIFAALTEDGFVEKYAVRLDGTTLKYKPERPTGIEYSALPKINRNSSILT